VPIHQIAIIKKHNSIAELPQRELLLKEEQLLLVHIQDSQQDIDS
jgi:hypothetical protein